MSARRSHLALGVGMLTMLLTLALWLAGALAWPELVTLDLRYQVRGRLATGDQIVIVPISRRMFELGTLTWPLPRAYYIHALENLRLAGARAVGLDVLLETGDPDDAALAAELRRWQGRAVLAYRVTQDPSKTFGGRTTIDTRNAQSGNAQSYASLSGDLMPLWPRGVGYVEVTQDQDGVVHTAEPRRKVAGTLLDSFPLALVRAADPAAARRYDATTALAMNYAGPPGTFPSVPNGDLDQVAAGLFDPRTVAGKIVLIGATDPALKDLFVGPFDGGAALTPGVELHANAVWTLLRDQPLQPVPRPLDAAALLALGGAVLGAGTRLRPLPATAAAIVICVGYLALCQVLFAQRIWLDLAGPLLAAVLAYVGAQTARAAEFLRELRRVESIFGRYVTPSVMRQLLGKPDALRLGGRRREISVLFADIRGFTTLSEQLPPEEIGAMLNEYFTAVVDVIFAHGGTVDKFVGDAIMALFNAPLDQPDHAARAVAAARAMQDTAAALALEWAARGRPALRIGIGVHSGAAIIGSFGSERRSEYTALGDTVNVASRLEGMSKELDCAIVVSEATASLLPAIGPFAPLGTVPIRGRAEPLALYGLRRSTT